MPPGCSLALRSLSLLLFAFTPAGAQSNTAAEKPVSATVVNLTEIDGWKVGDIQVTLANGRTELLMHGERCDQPHISSHGDVGWTVWADYFPGPRYNHTFETLRVRLHDGSTSDFKPNAYFIMEWNFTDDDKALAIASMEHHGPQYFIKYDIKTGQVLDRIDTYTPYADLPKWARPLSDNKP
jgi:hypothetical protein